LTVIAEYNVVPKYLFLDWSGDAGFKFGRGSSEYLIWALVSSTDYGRVRKRLVLLRRELGLFPLFEFHYKQTPPDLRAAFFETLCDLPFSAEVLIVHKPSLPPSFARMKEAQLYGRFVADLLLRTERTSVDQALLLVDAQRSAVALVRGIRVVVSRAMEEAGLPHRLTKVKPRPAKEEDGLQIADMIAGTTVDWLEGKQDYLVKVEEHLRIRRYEPK